ncbi:membrane alanyl aminopeptidase-like [Anthonomus grandis grandis]|uniref:membrane alanyl aminopeptidase-like n=1 Tax=Anthonomus grandis grandis TaxID=2921223 RepID=UPI0021650FF4|nr:membrane alanyl aminopeptidase-like [Anthonomus grandis grandis]
MRLIIIPFIVCWIVRTIAQDDDPYRLPPNYIVNHYDIDLTIPEETLTTSTNNNYSGYVEIIFQVTVQTSEVKLHSGFKNIQLLSIQLDSETHLTSEQYQVNSTTDILTLQFKTDLVVGKNYTLKIAFNAKLLTSGGFYKASYTDTDGIVQYIATTQFEATNARFAFPCFDEPRYKATFAYNLTYPANMTALTNTPSMKNISNADNTITTIFGTSPKMPVYLVAFIISKYTCTEGDLEGSSEFKHHICSREDKESARNWSMYVTPKVIDHLNSYTQYNYTNALSKLDQVAVSGKSGAMENWGLILYSESGLLFDNTLQTNANKQSITAVIAHELAHQWFGNLVTCKWWSETFLNEGFATMFEYYTANAVVPELEMEKQFVIRILQYVMTLQGSLNVPALRSNASTPAEISAKFGTYTYYKGGSVLRMIEHIVGRLNFKSGLQKYLLDNAFEPVEPQDLWDALEGVIENSIPNLPVGVNLTTVVDNWINKGGYPVINITLLGTNVILTQQRFLYSGTDNENSSWYVPISYSTADFNLYNENTDPIGWVTPTNPYIISGFSNSSNWIVINNQQTGFYRVNYDTTLWNNLATALLQTNFSGIHELNRAQIIDDSNQLAKAGYLSYSQVLRNTEFLANDTSYFSWYPATSLFWYLLQKTGSMTTLGAALTQHFLQLISNAADSVPLETVNEDAHIYTLNQILINTYACKFGNNKCATAAKLLFKNYKDTYERPNINIRSVVYCNGIRHSEDSEADWNFLYKQYQNSSVSQDSSTIWSALGCATNTTILRTFLSKILTSDGIITSSQYTSIFSTINNGNEIGVDTALEFFIENYRDIISRYNSSGLSVNEVLAGFGSTFTKISQIQKLESFLSSAENLTDSITESVKSAIATAKSNQEIINQHTSALYTYFGLSDDETSSTSTSTTTLSTTSSVSSTTTTSTTSSTSSGTSSTASPDTSGTESLSKNTCSLWLLFIFVSTVFRN